MKLKLITLSALSLFTTFSRAQTLLYNDGAMIKIQAGATLYVEGGVHNTSSGEIDNDGTLEIKGDFINEGAWEATDANTIKFSGDVDSDVTSGGAMFHDVVIQKGATYNVNLMDNMSISSLLNFANPSNHILLGDSDLFLTGSATTIGYSSAEFVITDGMGSMKKEFTMPGSFEYPVGFSATTYNPATLNVTAGPSDTYSVRVDASPTDGDGLTGNPITSDVVDAVWDIQETVAGGNTYDVTLSWMESDELTGFEDLMNAVSRNDGVNGWDAQHGDLGPEVSNTRTRTGLTGFGAFAVGDQPISNNLLVNVKVFLQGPYSGSTGMMWDSLRANDYIPLEEPYSTLPQNPYTHKAYGGDETVSSLDVFNQTLNGDDVIDWIVVELRNSTTPTLILATKTALLQRDGNIVDLDGVSQLTIPGMADGDYYIGLRHRNHLGVRSAATYSLNNASSTLIDFTIAGTAFDNPAITRPTTPMRTLSGGALGLWAGDANFNGFVSYNGGSNDKNVILATLSGNVGAILYGYNRADLNLNGATSYNGGANDKNVILGNMAPDLATPLQAHNNN